MSPVFFSVSNFSGIGLQASSLGVITAGESLILLIGGMDLSLEGIYGFAPMLAAWLIVPVAPTAPATNSNAYLGILVCSRDRRRRRFDKQHPHRKGAPQRLYNHSRDADPTGVAERHREGRKPCSRLPSAFAYLGSAYWGQVPVLLVATVLIFIGMGCSCATTGPGGPSMP